MLYFIGEVFRHLASQNRGHIRVMSESQFSKQLSWSLQKLLSSLCFLSPMF